MIDTVRVVIPNYLSIHPSIYIYIYQALEEEAFPSESHPGSSKGSRRPSKTSIELTSPPYTSTAGKATGQTFKGWLGGKLSTTTPPLN